MTGGEFIEMGTRNNLSQSEKQLILGCKAAQIKRIYQHTALDERDVFWKTWRYLYFLKVKELNDAKLKSFRNTVWNKKNLTGREYREVLRNRTKYLKQQKAIDCHNKLLKIVLDRLLENSKELRDAIELEMILATTFDEDGKNIKIKNNN
eukprot:UN30839